MVVKLTEQETKSAMDGGREAISNVGSDQGFTVNIDTLKAHQMGCAAEIALCRLFGIEWGGHGLELRHRGDVGNMEVRSTKVKNGRLICNARDVEKRRRKFVLIVSLGNREFDIKGWAYGFDVMKPENEFTRDQFVEKCWALTQDQLKPMELLRF